MQKRTNNGFIVRLQNGCGGEEARLAVSGASVDMKSTLLANGQHLLLGWFGNTTWCDNMGGQLVVNKVKIESPKSMTRFLPTAMSTVVVDTNQS